jgi:hypothetical protein
VIAASLRRAWTPETRIVALSFLILYLELALIRWVSGYVHNFGYFTNFAMLGAFLGIGVGCLLARRRTVLTFLPIALLVLALIVRVANVQIDLPATSPTAAFWSEAQVPEGKLSVGLGITVLFVLITFVFVGLGQLLGALFIELPRLRAYGLNVRPAESCSRATASPASCSPISITSRTRGCTRSPTRRRGAR